MTRVTAKTLVTTSKLCVTGGLAWVGALGWLSYRSRRLITPDIGQVCPALVLGCRTGPRLARRVAGAVQLYELGYASRIIISGLNEADAGHRMATDAGVPSHDVQVERRATNTAENMSYSARLLSNPNIWLVSCRWHLPRALHLARHAGLSPSPYPVEEATSRRVSFKIMAREAVSVVHHLT